MILIWLTIVFLLCIASLWVYGVYCLLTRPIEDDAGWVVIEEGSKPSKGDEAINKRGFVLRASRKTDSWTAEKWISNNWTHYRAINAPDPLAVQRREGD